MTVRVLPVNVAPTPGSHRVTASPAGAFTVNGIPYRLVDTVKVADSPIPISESAGPEIISAGVDFMIARIRARSAGPRLASQSVSLDPSETHHTNSWRLERFQELLLSAMPVTPFLPT